MMMKTIYTIIFAFVATMLISSCAYAVRYDRPYEGRIIDVDTGQPLEGVVVLGVWYKEEQTVAGAVSTYYDARETITGKYGEFNIPGQGLKIMTNVAGMNVLIFKAGYTYFGPMTWKELRRTVKLEGTKPVIRLRKLTIEERKKQSGPPDPPSEAPLKNVILLLREIDKYDKERGLPTRGIWKGEKYE
jgi:hypothetical protein